MKVRLLFAFGPLIAVFVFAAMILIFNHTYDVYLNLGASLDVASFLSAMTCLVFAVCVFFIVSLEFR